MALSNAQKQARNRAAKRADGLTSMAFWVSLATKRRLLAIAAERAQTLEQTAVELLERDLK
jgi:hypothetical protein